MKCTWKKTVLFALTAVMALSLAACGQQGGDTPASGAQPAGQSGREASTPAPSAPDTSTPEDSQSPGGGNVLVVYYSASGHTESVANYIAQAAGGDLFALTPAEPYTDGDLNWTDENSRVSREYADESLRDVELTTTEVENWDSYDTVFIGYPIWWGIAAWPVDAFVEANDFTGKTVVPFCTSSSSGLARAGSASQRWRAPAPGWRGSASGAGPLRRMCLPGWRAWALFEADQHALNGIPIKLLREGSVYHGKFRL